MKDFMLFDTKPVKQFLCCAFLLSIVTFSYAQTHTATFSNSSGEKKIKIILDKGGINISTHTAPGVELSTDDYKAPPERAKGLRPLYNSATDNTGIGLDVTESGNVITIKKASNEDMDFDIKVPQNVDVYVEEVSWQGNGIRVKDVRGEIEIKAKGSDIQLANISGPIVASTVNGDIEVKYETVNQEAPSSISATNGFVDVSLPASTKADLKMKSYNGEIYTDLDIEMPGTKEGMQRLGGRSISGTLNGGGVEITLNAINSDIYLRKK